MPWHGRAVAPDSAPRGHRHQCARFVSVVSWRLGVDHRRLAVEARSSSGQQGYSFGAPPGAGLSEVTCRVAPSVSSAAARLSIRVARRGWSLRRTTASSTLSRQDFLPAIHAFRHGKLKHLGSHRSHSLVVGIVGDGSGRPQKTTVAPPLGSGVDAARNPPTPANGFARLHPASGAAGGAQGRRWWSCSSALRAPAKSLRRLLA